MTTHKTPPPVQPSTSWRFPSYASHQLDNGLQVLVYQCPGQYVACASLVCEVPLNVEPAEVEGVAEMTARCLSRGTTTLTAEGFADQLAAAGADLQADASLDAFTVRLNVPVTHLGDGLGLLAGAVADATFASSEVIHERELRLQEIEQAHVHPQHVANEQLNAALFGSARAARPVGGTTTTVRSVERKHVTAYAESYLNPASSTLVLAGDFTSLDVIDVTDRCLSRWTRRGEPPSEREEPSVAPCAQLLFVDWPDAPQSTIRVAGPAITRAHALWPPMFVANHAVGGSFSSRINTVLREQKGYTYGAMSMLDSTRCAGFVAVSTAVTSEATADAVADILTILADAQGTLTTEEVATAVRAVTSSAPLGYERAVTVAGRVELLLSQRLPLNHVDVNLERIGKVTTEAANSAYSTVLDPASLTVLVVGASTARKGLAALRHAEIREVDLPWRS